MTDPLGHSSSVYDADGNLVATTDADGRLQTMAYDPFGELVTETQYDAQGHITDTLSFAYNADGNLLSASDNAATDSFTYNALGQLTTAQEPFGVSLDYSYDADGNVTTVTDSLGGTTTSTYDPLGQLTSRQLTTPGQAPVGVDFTYTPFGAVATQTQYGAQTVATTTNSYDADERLTGILQTGPTGTIASYAYTYDSDDRLTFETDNGVTTNYSYDADGQLTTAGATTYSYDANGNRVADTTGPDNELLSDGTWNYSYDADGNRVAKVNSATGETWTYGYNDDNQLLWAQDNAADGQLLERIDYAYDALGNLIQEAVTNAVDSLSVEQFAYDGDQVFAVLNGDGQLAMRYLNGDAVDEVIARVGGDGVMAWLLTDRLGSVRDVVDNSGTVIDQITDDAYGNIVSQTDPTAGGEIQFASMRYDAALGMYTDNARVYDPETGEFIEQDPTMFEAGDPNLYGYTDNQPTDDTDPTGLSPWSWMQRQADSAYNSVTSTASSAYHSVANTAGAAQDYVVNSPAYAFTRELVIIQGGGALKKTVNALDGISQDFHEGVVALATTRDAWGAARQALKDEAVGFEVAREKAVENLGERIAQKAELRGTDLTDESVWTNLVLLGSGVEDYVGGKVVEALSGFDSTTGKAIEGDLWDGGERTQKLLFGIADLANALSLALSVVSSLTGLEFSFATSALSETETALLETLPQDELATEASAEAAPSRALGGGVRNSAPLTDVQMQELRKTAGQLGFGPDDIRFTRTPSIFSDLENKIWIGPNILPAPASEQVTGSLFERLTARAGIAHEGGHLITTRAGTSLEPGSLLDEVQASLVGRQLPGLSKVERYQLLRGAAEDARKSGTSLRELLPQLPALSPR